MRIETGTILRLSAFGAGTLAALAAAVEIAGTIVPEPAETELGEGALSETLARCRSLAPEDYAADTECRTAWEENRRRFFGPGADPAGTD